MVATKLDHLDYKILALLDVDVRCSTSDLARRVRHGRDIVQYRVERLFREGIVRSTQAVVNPYRMGYTLYKTFMRLKNNQQRCRDLVEYLRSSPANFCVALCDGSWDIAFNTLARSAQQFDGIQNEILTAWRDLIMEFEVAVVIEQQLYPRGYLNVPSRGSKQRGSREAGIKDGAPFVIGGEPEGYECSPLELQLLNELVKDARISVAALATRTSSTPAIVQNRVDRLEDLGIIVGYRGILDLAALGLTNFKTQLVLQSFTNEDLRRLKKFCALHPHIVKCITQLGNCKIELNIEARGYDHFYQITQELRGAFPAIVVNITTLFVREETYLWLVEAVELPGTLSPRTAASC
jgi:DNA-binding Lrp family transcriptional regulator